MIEELWRRVEADPTVAVTVDLERRTVSTADGLDEPFDVDDYVRWRLLHGYDDIGLTLRHQDEVTAFERSRPAFLPSVR